MTKEFHIDADHGVDSSDGASVPFKSIARGLQEWAPDVALVLFLRGIFDEHPVLLSGVHLLGEGLGKTVIQNDITSMNDGRIVTIAGDNVRIEDLGIWDKGYVDDKLRIPLGIRGIVRGFVANRIKLEGVTDGFIGHGNGNELEFIDSISVLQQDGFVMLAGDGSTTIKFTRHTWRTPGSERAATCGFRAAGVAATLKGCDMALENSMPFPFGVLGIAAHSGAGNAATRFDIEDTTIFTSAPGGGTDRSIDMSAGGVATVRGGNIDRTKVFVGDPPVGKIVFAEPEPVPPPKPQLTLVLTVKIVKQGPNKRVTVTIRTALGSLPWTYSLKAYRPDSSNYFNSPTESTPWEKAEVSFTVNKKQPGGTWRVDVTGTAPGYLDGKATATFQV